MANRQYTFSLPPEVGDIIDTAPKMEKSKIVAQAILNFEKERARQRALEVVSSLNPKKWNTTKDAVELVREARAKRGKDLLNN